MSDAAFDRDDAGTRRDAVDQNGARAAFAEAAAIFRPVQFEIIAQHMQQCRIGSGSDIVRSAVDGEAGCGLRHAPYARPAPKFRRGYRLHTNVQAMATAVQCVARFMNNAVRQLNFYSATALPDRNEA
jgi:hypothetical protein